MTFFDDIKRGASDVAGKVAKKTGELTGIAKINFNIKTSEAKLSSVYEEIGFLFYTAERNNVDFTEEIAAQVLKADGIIVEIDNLKKEAAKLRGARICSGCGNEIGSECAFCSFCGKKQEAEKSGEEACSCECCHDNACDCSDSSENE